MAVDQWNYIYVAGAFVPKPPGLQPPNAANNQWQNESFSLVSTPATPNNYIPSGASVINISDNICQGYVTKYRREEGIPDTNTSFGIVAPIDGAVVTMPEAYATIKKMEVDREGFIHVMGEFMGEGISLINSTGIKVLDALIQNYQSDKIKVFLATFDPDFNGYVCHIIQNQDYDTRMGDVTYGVQGNPGPSLYFAVACKGEDLQIETHFVGQAPYILNAPIANTSDYDIFLGQIDLSNYQVIATALIEGEGDAFPGELSSGYQGYYATENALFLTGTFTSTLVANDPVLGMVTYTGTPPLPGLEQEDDIFAIRFKDSDIQNQEVCIAGGVFSENGICISDNGYKIGGYLMQGASFGSAGTAGTFGTSQYSGYSTDTNRQVGFIAEPDYDNHDWNWFEIIDSPVSTPAEDCAVISIAEDNCGEEFYVNLEHAMHGDVFGTLRQDDEHFLAKHVFNNNYPNANANDHFFFSELQKWRLFSGTVSQIWAHDFAPLGGNLANGYNALSNGMDIKAKFIEDIVLFNDLGTDTVDLAITGRFGTDIDLTSFNFTKPITPNFFDGNAMAPYFSGPSSMFIAALDENPILDTSFYSFCLTDAPSNLSCPIMPTWAGTPSYSMANLNLQFIGPGITNSTLGTFDPFIAGIGSHEILVFAEYFGCGTITPGVVKVEVLEAIYPRHPTTTGTQWAEGLSATGVQRLDLEDTPTSGDYYITYLAGKYYDQISFDKDGGGVITLNAPASQEAGYIVANGPCGALWALNFTSNGNAYIENLELKETYGVDDTEVKPILYAVGGTRGSVSVTNSEIGIQSPAQLSSLSYSSSAIPAANEKGLLCEIDPLTGEVNWMYHGGYYANERNRFHDLAVTESYIAIIGERWGNFTYLSKTAIPVTLSAVSAEDPIMVLLDIDGNAKQTNVIPGTPGFGGPGNDRGDAIDMKVVKAVYAPSGAPITYSAFEALEIVYGGYMEPGLINYDYTTLVGNNNIPAIEGKNVYLAHSSYDIINDVMINNRFRIIPGDGDDELRDIHLFGLLKHQAFDPAKSDQIFICGKFADRFEPLTTNPLVTSGTGDYDIYIGCVNRNLGNRWFTHEGSPFGLNEAANALESKDGILYAYGEVGGSTIISNRHSGLSQTSPSLLNGVGVNPRHTIFSVAFAPNGTLLDQVLTFPGASGLNQGWDITVMDTMLVTAGTIGLSSGFTFDFLDNSNNIHHFLYRNSSVRDAFMGRIAPTNGSYFKADFETHTTVENQWVQLFPNPNHGSFNLVFDGVFTGELIVRDIQGRVMKTEWIQNSLAHSVQLNLAAGIYAIELKNSAISETILFVIE